MSAPLAYCWGDDALAVREAIERFAAELAVPGAEPLDRWRPDRPASGESEGVGQLLAETAIRLGTAPLFGSGVLVVIREPAALARSKPDRARLVELLDAVAPGNGLAFGEVLGSNASPGAGTTLRRELCAAIEARGGLVQEFRVPRGSELDGWIGRRAAERGVRLEPAAQHLLAERVGGAVREGDVDRRNQTDLADAELTKLALYRPDTVVTRGDVDALVTPTIPASSWAFLDAVAGRRAGPASDLADRLLAEGLAMPVIVTQLHRRLRQLVEIQELLGGGAAIRGIVAETRLNPYRAEILAKQARAWSPSELDAAIDGLFALDLASKGLAGDGRHGGPPASRAPLALEVWIAEHVGRRR